MTWIAKAAADDQAELAKWRVQADNAAAHMKGITDWGAQVVFTPAFVFDDGMVKLPISVSLIQRLNEQALADWVFNTVLEAQSSVAQAPAVNRKSSSAPSSSGPEQPAATEPCIRRLEPDFTQACPNLSAGGLRITLKPAETVEKRWGKHSLLTFMMDLTVCTSCLPKVTIMEITDPDLRARLSKAAQQMNNGVLVDWTRTQIEQIPFTDPQYAALRAEISKKATAAVPACAEAGRDDRGAARGPVVIS